MKTIKLLNTGDVKINGATVTRLQSQLYIGSDTADYTLEGGVLKNYGQGKNGFDF